MPEAIHELLFDTHVVIWGIQGIDEPTEDEQIIASLGLIDNLTQTSCKLSISSVSVTEALIGIERIGHDSFIKEVENGFSIKPYNTNVARTTAEIIQDSRPEMEALINELRKNRILGARRIVHNDMKIIGTAKHRNIKFICTNDKKIHRLGEPYFEKIYYPTQLNDLYHSNPELFRSAKDGK